MAALFQKRKKEPAEKTPVEAAQALQETIVCPACGREINKKEAEKNLYVCYECGSYFRVRTRNRIRMVADAGTFTPWFEDLAEANPLEFPGYEDKVKAAKEKHVLLELNNTSLNPDGPRQGAYDNDVTMLKLCKEAGVCISIGSDAHIKESICDFDRAYKVIEEVGFPKELIVNSNTELYESYIGKRQ